MPLALLTLVVMTVGVATAFARVQSEMQITGDRQAETDAFAYATGSLERFAIDRTALGFSSNPPLAVESVRIMLPGGWADVISRRVKPKTATSDAVYLLTSKAVRRTGNAARMPQAEATASQYAFFREGKIKIISAWTSLSGLHKNGGAGSIDGNDSCSALPAVAGVAVPTVPGYTQSGGASVPTGSPPIDDLGSQAAANAAVGIDWNAIVNGGAIVPDLTFPTPDSWPASFPAGWWPVIYVNGDLSLPTDGRGTLIVTGNMTIGGTTKWDGVILVGGTIYANGNNNVHGGVISGLNEQLGISVPQSDIGNGTKTYVYDSCAIANAASRFAALVLVSKTWSNNWPVW
jgi:hypothetical protein